MKLIQILLASAARGTEGGIRFWHTPTWWFVLSMQKQILLLGLFDHTLQPHPWSGWSPQTPLYRVRRCCPPCDPSVVLLMAWSGSGGGEGFQGVATATGSRRLTSQLCCSGVADGPAYIRHLLGSCCIYQVSIRQSSTVRSRSDCCDMVLDT